MTNVPMGTLDASEFFGDSQEADAEQSNAGPAWGRLLPLKSTFVAYDLRKDDCSFGRGDDVDCSFNTPSLSNTPYFQAFSKLQFRIFRENNTSTGWHCYIQDFSSNGTFLNDEKIGKGKKRILKSNDTISIALLKCKAFVFTELNAGEDLSYPQPLRDKFIISKVLGRGAMGEVHLMFDKATCGRTALKVIQKSKFTLCGRHSVDSTKAIMREVSAMKALSHPCITKIEEFFDTPERAFLVLELVEGGELFDRIVSNGKLDERISKLYFYQMLLAIKYLHDCGITHRDLKPENILLSSESLETLIKISDFGLSKVIDSESMLKTFCGTPNYLAPEILETAGSGTYTEKVDLWALGVILFISLSGYPPFSSDYKDMQLQDQIKTGRYDFPKKYWGNISSSATQLIERLLTVDPKQRISVDDALAHPWLADQEMKRKAHMLMYPDSDGMIPPQCRGSPSKKRGRATTDDSSETMEFDEDGESLPPSKRERQAADVSG